MAMVAFLHFRQDNLDILKICSNRFDLENMKVANRNSLIFKK